MSLRRPQTLQPLLLKISRFSWSTLHPLCSSLQQRTYARSSYLGLETCQTFWALPTIRIPCSEVLRLYRFNAGGLGASFGRCFQIEGQRSNSELLCLLECLCCHIQGFPLKSPVISCLCSCCTASRLSRWKTESEAFQVQVVQLGGEYI